MENQDQNTPVTGTVVTPTPQGPGASYTDVSAPSSTTNATQTVANPVDAPIIPSENSLETPETPANSAQSANPTQVTSTPIAQETKKSFSRLIFVIAGIVILILIAVVVVANIISRRQSAQLQSPAQSVNEQGITLGSATVDTLTALQLEGSQEKLIVNGDIVLSGRLSVGSGAFYGQFVVNNLTANRSYVLPDADGTVCLDSNNCNFALNGSGVDSINGVNGILTLGQGLGLQGTTIVNTQNELTPNEVISAMVFQGTNNQVGVTVNGNVITFTTPQDIGTSSSPIFSGVSVGTLTVTGGNASLNGLAYTLPSLQGNGVLTNDGSGGLTWTAAGGLCPTCFVNGGNDFGGVATLGTNSAHNLAFETGGVVGMELNTDSQLRVGNYDTGFQATLTVTAVTDSASGIGLMNGYGVLASSGNGTNYGLYNEIYTGGAQDYDTSIGLQTTVRHDGSGNIDTARALVARVINDDGGSIIDTNGILIQSTQNNGVGSISNNYGLYIEDQSGIGVTSNYNILSAGEGYNWFQGNTAIGNHPNIENVIPNSVLTIMEEVTGSGYGIGNSLDVTATSGGNSNIASLNQLSLRGNEDYSVGIGVGSAVNNYSTGTVDYLFGTGSSIFNLGSGTVSEANGILITSTENSGGGTINENYGLKVETQTAGVLDFGIRVETADTQTLWVGGDEGTLNSGIAFGLSRDTNLYRSAADVLRTDDAFSIGTLGTADNATYLCRNSSNIIAACSGTATGSAFVQGGNSFGGTATLGTNDSNSLAFETSGVTRLTLGASNGFIAHTPATSTSTTPGDEAAHVITFSDTGAVTTGGTMDNTMGLSVSVTRTGASGLATTNAIAGRFEAIGDLGGTSSASGVLGYGVGADTNVGVTGISFQTGANATTSIIGVQGAAGTVGAIGGTVTAAYALHGAVEMNGGGSTFTTAAGLNIASASNGAGAGVIASNYGIKVEAQTAGTSDYGIRVDTADTQTLWIAGNAADPTTASAGIAFGSARDTNLYRSAADTLKTDDSLEVGVKLQVGPSATVSTLSQCASALGLFTCQNTFESGTASTETTTPTYGGNFITGITPAGATNTQGNRALNATLILSGAHSFSSASSGNYGLSASAVSATSAGTITLLGGVHGTVIQGGAGSTVTEATGVTGAVGQSAGTLTTGYGMRVLTATGTIGTNYGMHIQAQTAGTSDYGIRVDTADTQTLWIGGTAAGDAGTANTGIAFGSARDTNLYRSAADTLKTDDSLHVTNNVGIGVAPGTYKLNVNADTASGYVANFFNDGDDQNRYGIRIQAGADDGSGTTYYLDAYDGNGDQVGYIANTSGTFALTDVSDVRTKTNIADTNVDALSVLNGLRVVDFNRIQNPDGPLITGFIAQEVQGIYSQAVTTSSSGLLGVAKEAFIPVLVKGVQQQQGQITDINGRVAALERRVNEFNLQQNQGGATGTLADLNVSGPATITNLTVTGVATVGTLTVTGNAHIAGNITLGGHVLGNADTRGSVTIPAGQIEVKRTFLKPYSVGSEPSVILTPKNTFAPKYRVESTNTEFTIYFEAPAAVDVVMNYQIQE